MTEGEKLLAECGFELNEKVEHRAYKLFRYKDENLNEEDEIRDEAVTFKKYSFADDWDVCVSYFTRNYNDCAQSVSFRIDVAKAIVKRLEELNAEVRNES